MPVSTLALDVPYSAPAQSPLPLRLTLLGPFLTQTIGPQALALHKLFFTFLTPYDVGCLRGYPTISRMKTKIMTSQLELSLPKQRACRSLERPRRHHSRASFWFQRMRHVVENATNWPPFPRTNGASRPIEPPR